VYRLVGWIGGTCGVALLVVAALGWLAGNAPASPADAPADAQIAHPLGPLAELPGLSPGADGSPPVLADPKLVSLLGGVGLVLLGLSWIRARRRKPGLDKVDARLARKTLRQAAALARRGDVVAAAELCRESDLAEEAVEYFVAAEEYGRAAEVRHDQNRFLESADLYCKAGNFESAGTILASQEEFVRAAQCYRKAGRHTVAGEMYERAGDPRRAGKCYAEADFHRLAADAYQRAQCWGEAAGALERVVDEELLEGADGGRRQREREELVRKAAMLHEQADDLEAAQNVLVRGRCYAEAGEIALRLEQYARAAELFVEARDAPRAAKALRQIGEERAAARVLGQHHRDHGDDDEAAHHLEAAGEYLDAGDLYRKLEDFERAGECYERHGDGSQAAEMFKLVGEPIRAAGNFERAGRYLEAAECWQEAGDRAKQAELLAKAGRALEAGRLYHDEGLDDEAIKILQQVTPESADFGEAAGLLGGIFRARGLHSLAIKKLAQAIGEAELGHDNLDVYYQLATLHEAAGEFAKATDLYERILAIDYHHADVGERLAKTRRHLDAGQGAGSTTITDPSALAPGGRNGRYEILGELGRGGMGIVYKARDTVLDRVVAYKVLPDALKENPQALKNFLREAKSAAQLNHPNIVTVYDAGEQDGRYYIAMEYVDGTTLKEILRRRRVIATGGLLQLLLQLCEALAYAHDKKIVHRDVKTANTMWTRDRKAKIMDFGLAKIVEEVRNHTTLVSGTPYYMSPEQTLGHNVDHRTDIYSLGVMAFELATGTLPFREGNVPYHHVHTPAPDPRETNPELPEPIAAIILRCLQKEPAERFESTREIIVKLREVAARISASESS
jgi:tetratricopeptide (TPR) repeat protein